jgi:AAA domain, putative AbiEii toxin, Type IV TA system
MAELLHHLPTLPLSEGYRLVESQQLKHSGSRADLVAWLGVHSHFVEQRGGRAAGFVRFGQQQPLPPTTAAQAWDRVVSGASPGSLGELAPFVLQNADPTTRRDTVGGVQARQTADEPPTHPLHYMEDDRTLLQRLSELSQEVFGYPLTLDTTSTALLLRVGTPSIPAPRVDESQAAYRANMATLPPLSQQGDGMRSFLGLLLPLITASHPIVVVDEPEAFLHPPQAAALGRALSALARDNKLQVILATHDRNLLTGLLDVAGVPISIVRLHRDRNQTIPYQLNPADVRDLWTDVTFRYTNVIDGLFHRLVIAEADRDCRFYAAALDAVHEDTPLAIPPSEVLFVPSNGKQGMARLVRALQAVHAPVVTSPDLDILNDGGVLKALVRELGGTWDSMAQDYRIATDPFRQPRDPTRNSDVLAAIEGVLGASPGQTYNADVRNKVLAQLRSNESRWQSLKTAGDRAFIGAQATAAAQRLLNALDAIGVVTVRVGQLGGRCSVSDSSMSC